MTTRLPRGEPPPVESADAMNAILAELAALRAGQDAMREEVKRLVTLLSGGGARDGADVDVIEALSDAMRGQPFTSGQAIDYAKRQAAAQRLHDAL